MQYLRCLRCIFIIFNTNTGELFCFRFVWRNNVHQRQQFVRKFASRSRVKRNDSLILMGDFRRCHHTFEW
ncbi:Uncharacterised protein [Klebsiella pneumoniae]|nr:Uncharacterised protein [Klebsiella pneumoniae]